MHLKRHLQDIGLSDKQAAVYLALLELGQTSVARIARKARIKRTTVYPILHELKDLGLVGTAIHHGKKSYFAEDPSVLRTWQEQKLQRLMTIMPQLQAITNLLDNRPTVRFYEGQRSVEDAYNETLTEKDTTIYAWFAEGFHDGLRKEFVLDYMKRRVRRRIRLEALVHDNPTLRTYIRETPQSLRNHAFVRTPPELQTDTVVLLYNNRSTLFASHKENIALIIDSADIYKTLRGIFAVIWHTAAHDRSTVTD